MTTATFPAAVLAVDLDRTFTAPDLSLDPVAVLAARRLRRRGVRLVLATGRSASLMPLTLLEPVFDGFVVEGGALWGRPGQWTVLAPDDTAVAQAAAEVAEAGIPLRQGHASFSIPREVEPRLTQWPALQRCSWRPNRDRIDVVPRGVDKGASVLALLASWSAPKRPLVAIGDGENDLDLLRVADHAVAVANAAPELLAAADEVTAMPASQGFCWLADRLVGPPEAPA